MKYSASINVMDDQGVLVREIELSNEELITFLLHPRISEPEVDEETDEYEKKEPAEVGASMPSGLPYRVPKDTFKAKMKEIAGKSGGATQKEKRKSTCGKCGQSGHNAKTCTRAAQVDQSMAEETAEWKQKKEAKRVEDLKKRVGRCVQSGLPSSEIIEAFPNEDRKEIEELIAYAEHQL